MVIERQNIASPSLSRDMGRPMVHQNFEQG